MQDRYLFRGKRIDNGEWAEGSLILNTAVQTTPFIVDSCFGEKGKINKDGYEEFDWLSAYEVDPATVGQCTGLKDKNGELIFEGDKVRFVNRIDEIYDEQVGVCVFEQEESNFVLQYEGYHHDHYALHTVYLISNRTYAEDCTYEIIGNIHDKEGEDV